MSSKLHAKPYSNNLLFFEVNPAEQIAQDDPVRIVDAMVESLDLKNFKKLYRERGRCAYHPKMMLLITFAEKFHTYSLGVVNTFFSFFRL